MGKWTFVLLGVVLITSAAEANLLSNPGFETVVPGYLDGNSNPSQVTVSSANAGVWVGRKRWMQLDAGAAEGAYWAGNGANYNWMGQGMVQFVPNVPNADMTLQFVYKQNGGTGLRYAVLGLNENDLVNLQVGPSATQIVAESENLAATGDAFETVTASFNSGSYGFIGVYFELDTQLNPAGAEGVDNVSLIPEPATLSLLGMGGVSLAMRRRRA